MYCLACGESYSSTEKPRPGIGADDTLFHCANLQGVLLGMGLSMVQKQYDNQGSIISPSPDEPDKKKRKIDDVDASQTTPSQPVVPPSWNPHMDEYYGTNKSKSGIGYAGTVKEDVSNVEYLLVHL